jgi:signal transduction histidine kinase
VTVGRGRALAGRHQEPLVAVAALALSVVPLLAGGGVDGPGEWIGAACSVAGALGLALWRRHPVPVLLAGPVLLMVCAFTGPEPSNVLLPVLMVYAALVAERFSGRSAWAAGLGCAVYVAALYAVTGEDSPGLLILIAPGFLAGTALRLRRETAEQLAARGRELDAERELFAEVSVRNERARIASELHDIVGHALSVMVVQAAAGQRLAPHSPDAAAESLAVIAESARHGRADLHRLIDLLAGTEVASPDLSLIDAVVDHAARSGLRVTCRFEGSRDGLRAEVAHAACRVVQESLTNALRHAPGAEVRVLVRSEPDGRGVTVRVENDRAPRCAPGIPGTGRGLIGLRERVVDLGGAFCAGPAPGGGWAVQATLAGDALDSPRLAAAGPSCASSLPRPASSRTWS